MKTLTEILAEHGVGDRADLLATLYEREDEIAEGLRMAGAQLGAFPEFVAEVITNTLQIGTPVSDEQKALVHGQFHVRMAWLQQEIRKQQGDV